MTSSRAIKQLITVALEVLSRFIANVISVTMDG